MDNQQAKVIYLAGLIDGEGCLDYQRNFNKQYKKYYYSPRLRICMTGDDSRLKELIRESGLPFWTEERTRRFKNPKWRDSWAITITGYKRLSKWVKAIKPYSIVKLKQWENIDNFIKSRHITNPDNGYSKIKDYTEYEMNLINEIRLLKGN